MKVESFACGGYLANCYILTDEDNGKRIMIDAPFEAERLIQPVAEIKYDMQMLIPFGSHDIRVLHTPGHTAGGVCYIIDDMLFSGDTLFKESVGRTDFPSGNSDELKTSLQRRNLLKGDYKVFPGHGDTTALGYERENNPYIKEAIIL